MSKQQAADIKQLKLEDINFKLLINNRRQLLIAICLAVSAVLIILFASYPQIRVILDSRSALEERLEYVERLRAKHESLNNIELTEEFSNADDINRVLPSHTPLIETLSNLDIVSQEANVNISRFNVDPGMIASESATISAFIAQDGEAVRSGGPRRLELNFTVIGRLRDIRDFIDLIEQTTPITTVTSIELTFSNQEDENALASADLITETNYFEKQITLKIDDPLPEITDRQREIIHEIMDYPQSQYLIPEQIEGGLEDPFDSTPPNVIPIN